MILQWCRDVACRNLIVPYIFSAFVVHKGIVILLQGSNKTLQTIFVYNGTALHFFRPLLHLYHIAGITRHKHHVNAQLNVPKLQLGAVS